MLGSEKEKKAVKESFRKMDIPQKAEYIVTYYKLPIITAIIAAAVLISTAVREFTRKEVVLYAGMANVAVGDVLLETLTDSYLLETDRNPKRNEVIVYRDLYLSEDPSPENHQFAYASKLKVLGAISARQFDFALMNREAYDQMSASGFLLELDELLAADPELYETVSPYVCENTVILEDNAIAYRLGEADEYESVTEDVRNAVDCSSFPLFREAGFSDDVYFGIIANAPRRAECVRWLGYICRSGD